MQLVEKHMISKTDARFALIDRAAFASKNLYNTALYEIRQHFIFLQATFLSFYFSRRDRSPERFIRK